MKLNSNDNSILWLIKGGNINVKKNLREVIYKYKQKIKGGNINVTKTIKGGNINKKKTLKGGNIYTKKTLKGR